MGAIPGTVDTEQQPPMIVPLRHFLVGIGFLLTGVLVGIGIVGGLIPGMGRLAHVHMLLAGWVCVTIMGAMTQFVPVWSGASLYSKRLASIQLTLVVAGLGGFAVTLVANALAWLPLFGGLMLVGFWVFVYNIVRTMAGVESFDVTERHFLFALVFFLVLTVLGYILAVDFTHPLLTELPVTRTEILLTHATVAVFGAVLTTIYGALYQLGTMFTQTELHGLDEFLQPIEEVGHSLGVVFLAVGRFTGWVPVARVGGLLIVLAALAFSVILARRLFEMQVDWTPMHTRYAVVAPALAGWALLSAPVWFRTPTAYSTLLGPATAVHLFVLGVIGFVVFGTLYHIVPFIIWVHRYSDLLGYEDVPMIDDLYSDRLATIDATLLIVGTVLLVGASQLPQTILIQGFAGLLVFSGSIVFAVNMLSVVRTHSPQPLDRILLGSVTPRRSDTQSEDVAEG